jgi:tetratricopeptide (TPR) repeat protein
MKQLSEAFSWLNINGASGLSTVTDYKLWQITTFNLPEKEVEEKLEALLRTMQTSAANSREYAELLARCAVIFSGMSLFDKARLQLKEALKIYEQISDMHRMAVIQWMISVLEWEVLENNRAFENAHTAEGIFIDLAEKTIVANEKVWYAKRIAIMDEDLTDHPEEVFFWLNQFGGSCLTFATRQITEQIMQEAKGKRFRQVYHLINSLVEMVRFGTEPMEAAEVYAFCGLTMFQIGNNKESIRLLRQSTALYPPEGHHHTLVYWMLGLILYTQPHESSEAFKACNTSIARIEQLKRRAEENNRQGKSRWYDQRAKVMRKVLEQKLNGSK